MKLFSLNSVLLVIGLFIVSCNSLNKSGDTQEMESKENKVETPVLDPNYMISKDTFDVWKERWDNNFRSYFNSDSLNYFSMPLFDMNAIIGENGTGSRLYMGMAIDSIGDLEPHVMLVGESNGSVNWSRIMDYTNACPPHCGN